MTEQSGGTGKSSLLGFVANMAWKPIIWSMIIGGVLTIFLGFNVLGDWHLGSTVAKALDDQEVKLARSYGVPLCVAQFMGSEQPAADIEEIEAFSKWRRGKELAGKANATKFSWVLMPGEEKANATIADDCAKQVIELKEQLAQNALNTG